MRISWGTFKSREGIPSCPVAFIRVGSMTMLLYSETQSGLPVCLVGEYLRCFCPHCISTLDMNSKIPSINTEAVVAFAKDLTKDYPRSPRETLAGYVIAARTLDKCRATLAGTAGDYHFDCPLDNFFFAFVEISAADFKNFVATGASDEQVAKWIEEKA